jgi:serine/threonine-protein kinase
MAELMYKIANEEAPGLLAVRPELPVQLAPVVARALAKKPELRHQDGDAFARELRAVLTEIGGPVKTRAAAAVADDQQTVAFRRAPAPDAAKTVVMGGHNAFGAGMGLPGYDAAQKDGLPGQAGQEP